jgi:hypothetical protein
MLLRHDGLDEEGGVLGEASSLAGLSKEGSFPVSKHLHGPAVNLCLPPGQENNLACFTKAFDFTQVRLAQAQAAAKSPPEHLVVFDWFLERVLPGHVDVGITHAQLVRAYRETAGRGGQLQASNTSLGTLSARAGVKLSLQSWRQGSYAGIS